MVTKVKIAITNAAGAIIEQGEAAPDMMRDQSHGTQSYSYESDIGRNKDLSRCLRPAG
jgi:hypothetical protein